MTDDTLSPPVSAQRRHGPTARRALVVGAGIAGDAAAVFLGRAGWGVVVVEIAAAPRSGGQTVDLRGPSAAVLDRLGLLGTCRQRLVPQRGIAWVDAAGRARARMPVEAFDGRGFVSRDELLRTDLSRVLHDACGASVTHRFGDTVERFEPDGDGVWVSFRSSPAERFDLVVGADGAHSRVRALLFGPEERFRRSLGLAHAWFTLHERDDTPPLDGWYQVHNAPGCKVVEARPGHPGQQEAGFTFPAPAQRLPGRGDRPAQMALLRQEFTGVGWRARELLAAAAGAQDLAFDTFDQIHLERWHSGRIVLLGDSAWCASPLSGLGTTLALLGASALAEAVTTEAAGSNRERLATTVLERALDQYERSLRPRVTAAQRLPPGRVRTFAPRSEPGIRATAALMRLIQTRPVAGAVGGFAGRFGHGDELPERADQPRF